MNMREDGESNVVAALAEANDGQNGTTGGGFVMHGSEWSARAAQVEARTDGGSASAAEEIHALAMRCKASGDTQAFDALVGLFQTPIYNLALRMTHDSHRAADATQEIFVKAYRSIGKFRGDASFKTWLFAIAANMLRNDWRSRTRRAQRETLFADLARDDADAPEPEWGVAPQAGPDQCLERSDFMRQVAEKMAELPADFAVVLTLRDVQDMSYEEIALTLRCSAGTVKSRLSRARTMLKNKLAPLWAAHAEGKRP